MNTLSLVGKIVTVEVTKEKRCKAEDVVGLLWNIDPETGCCVVVRRNHDGTHGVTIVTGHGVTGVTECENITQKDLDGYLKAGERLTKAVNAPKDGMDLADVKTRLDAARIPFVVTPEGVVSVLDGAAEITPPYGPQHVQSTNDQVLGNLINILK